MFIIGVLKQSVHIVEIIHGSAVTIQALYADVILYVPDGVYGIILGNIHTNHWKFTNFVHDDDCIIGPICEFHLSKGSMTPDKAMFRIQVAHIARQTSDIGKIRVKQGQRNEFFEIQPFSRTLLSDVDSYFKANSRYVDIYTHHFSDYIIYAEERNCCGQSIAMNRFSKMDEVESDPMATVILHFCSYHYIFEGYREVSDVLTFFCNQIICLSPLKLHVK